MDKTETSWEELPYQHQHALLAAKRFGGTMWKGMDTFVASASKSTLLDLVDLGLLRKSLASYSLTLKGWQLIGNRKLEE
jgi:hypothetical protein